MVPGGVIKHRALVASQPAAFRVLQLLLRGMIDLVPVHTPADAFRLLKQDADYDLIITTIAFDDSQMVEFVQAVKGNPKWARIPILCSRVLPGALSDFLVKSMREVCKQCQAVDLVDVARLPPDDAQRLLRAAVTSCIGAQRPGA
jgi:CheY-like chemotaxis protein